MEKLSEDPEELAEEAAEGEFRAKSADGSPDAATSTQGLFISLPRRASAVLRSNLFLDNTTSKNQDNEKSSSLSSKKN